MPTSARALLPLRQTLTGLALFVLAMVIPFSLRAETAPTPDGLAKNLIASIMTVNLEQFTANSTPDFKARATKELLQNANKQLGPKLQRGYELTYLGLLRQQGTIVYLYKLTARGEVEDILVRMATVNYQVAGFWLQ